MNVFLGGCRGRFYRRRENGRCRDRRPGQLNGRPPFGAVVELFASRGDGMFEPQGILLNDSSTVYVGVAAEDFNRDGSLDLAVTGAKYQSAVSLAIIPDDGQGGFQTAAGVRVFSVEPVGAMVLPKPS